MGIYVPSRNKLLRIVLPCTCNVFTTNGHHFFPSPSPPMLAKLFCYLRNCEDIRFGFQINPKGFFFKKSSFFLKREKELEYPNVWKCHIFILKWFKIDEQNASKCSKNMHLPPFFKINPKGHLSPASKSQFRRPVSPQQIKPRRTRAREIYSYSSQIPSATVS